MNGEFQATTRHTCSWQLGATAIVLLIYVQRSSLEAMLVHIFVTEMWEGV
jgi:hypothetical protein